MPTMGCERATFAASPYQCALPAVSTSPAAVTRQKPRPPGVGARPTTGALVRVGAVVRRASALADATPHPAATAATVTTVAKTSARRADVCKRRACPVIARRTRYGDTSPARAVPALRGASEGRA